MESEIRRRLGTLIYGWTKKPSGKSAETLERLKLSVSVVETFTGGIVSHKLAGTGASGFLQGYVLPADSAQKKFLDAARDDFGSLLQDQKRLAEAWRKGYAN